MLAVPSAVLPKLYATNPWWREGDSLFLTTLAWTVLSAAEKNLLFPSLFVRPCHGLGHEFDPSFEQTNPNPAPLPSSLSQDFNMVHSSLAETPTNPPAMEQRCSREPGTTLGLARAPRDLSVHPQPLDAKLLSS